MNEDSSSGGDEDFFTDSDPDYEDAPSQTEGEDDENETENSDDYEIPNTVTSDGDSSDTSDISALWYPVTTTNTFIYNEQNKPTGTNSEIIDDFKDASLSKLYLLFAQDAVKLLVEQTNLYAEQKKKKMIQEKTLKKHSRMKLWKKVDETEMRQFIAIIMYMNVVQLNEMNKYWRSDGFVRTCIPDVMSRNRFQAILSNLHCADNEKMIEGDRLHKIRDLVQFLESCFQYVYTPKEKVCVDESVVPFKGRLNFKQYIKNKRHKRGIKVFKVCTNDYYTLKYEVYIGRSEKRSVTEFVLDMVSDYLRFGRTLYTDNFYTSVELAEKLIQQKTHLVGTLQKNRKANPKEICQRKLKKGEYFALQNDSNIMILKWKDKRDVLMLSTKHKDGFETTMYRGKEIMKPTVVLEYNVGKSYIDRSDQMASYILQLRKSIKWYRKIIIDLLTSVCLINAYSVYKDLTNSSAMGLHDFQEKIIKELLRKSTTTEVLDEEEIPRSHELVKASRNRCINCYQHFRKKNTREQSQKLSKRTFEKCNVCNKHFCKPCFFKVHAFKNKK